MAKKSAVSTTPVQDSLGRTRAARSVSLPADDHAVPDTAAVPTDNALPALSEAPDATAPVEAGAEPNAAPVLVNTPATLDLPAATTAPAANAPSTEDPEPAPDATTVMVDASDPALDANPVAEADTAPPPADANTINATAPTYASVTAAPAVRQEEFPPLPSPSAAPPMSHAAIRKKKGKGRDSTAPPLTADDVDSVLNVHGPGILGNFFEGGNDNRNGESSENLGAEFDADLERAKTASLVQHHIEHLEHLDSSTPGASSSRRDAPDPAPASPPKRQRANTAGHAIHTGAGANNAPAVGPAARTRVRGINYHTNDGNPPRGSFTPVPPGGFRPIYGMTYTSLHHNVPADQRQQWDRVEHPKLIAVTAQHITQQIAGRLNLDPSAPRVGPPGLAEGPGHDPRAWLIGGLSLAQSQALLDGRVLAADGHTTFFFAYVRGFLGTFAGLTIPDNNHGVDLARAVLGDAIADNPAIARYDMTADETYARFAESLYVRPLPLLSPQGPFIGWNVYCTPPTNDDNVFSTLRGLVANLVVNTPFNGQGRIYCVLLCHICLSTDHPTNICPFPNYPGWMGPTPETIGALEQASRDALTDNKKGRNQGHDNGGKGGKKGKGKDRDARKGGYGRQ
ncbi:hypothetical protein DFH07DRAFT_766361 [Mycena maculata]|uniref:Uncharacterized protein n=1 Tax=Mycena maculata TaxID=230809 RepID=A0AAD7NWB5_9AGAR|nr:hypothetical protein DFH07DRAFT_766361 [Mycena maculata]